MALIAGPTASGKSDLAVRLAKAIEERGGRGVVINADSAQVYADLQVLSARPDEEEMQGIEHRLYGAWDGATACSAADWAEAAKREIVALHNECAVPILCGGTGLYMRTLLEGIAPVPPIVQSLRDEVRALSQADAREALEAEDPEAASRLAPADVARTARALEVVRSTGRTLKDWQGRKTGGIGGEITLSPLVLLPEREWLYERCDRRFGLMMEGGAVKDVLDARLMGADCVRLIAAALDDEELAEFHRTATEIGLDALVEVHDEAELERALAVGATLVGVNQRDLVTFEVDHERAVRMAAAFPDHVVSVAESGVRDADDAKALAEAGYDAVLVGESLVTSGDPTAAVAALRSAT